MPRRYSDDYPTVPEANNVTHRREDMLVAVKEWLARAEGRVIETDARQ